MSRKPSLTQSSSGLARVGKRTRPQMLERSRARDQACDGEFIVGVLSTGIYCLPSCPARAPKPENVAFFENEAGAKEAGLRACKRCRPQDFYRGYDPDRELVEGLARRIRETPQDFADARGIANHSGTGVTKLGALFREHYHTTPAAFLARARVARARELLANGTERVLDVGLAVGFESSSSFHDNFRRWSAMAPGEYRKLLDQDAFRLELPVRFLRSHHLAYLGRDAESVSEQRVGTRVLKGALLAGKPACIELDLGEESVAVRLRARGKLGPQQRRAAHEAVVQLLSLDQDPSAFERRLGRGGLARLVRGRRGLRIPQTATAFEGLAWAIIGQQINLPFAFALRRRMIELAGRRTLEGLVAHPTPAEVARLDPADLRKLQFSERKAEYLVDSARAIAAGELDLEALGHGSAERARSVLLARRGLGPWSVHYLQMRAFGLADCVPLGDTGLTSGLQRFFELEERPGPKETLELMQAFAPFRSLATFHLWNLDGPSA